MKDWIVTSWFYLKRLPERPKIETFRIIPSHSYGRGYFVFRPLSIPVNFMLAIFDNINIGYSEIAHIRYRTVSFDDPIKRNIRRIPILKMKSILDFVVGMMIPLLIAVHYTKVIYLSSMSLLTRYCIIEESIRRIISKFLIFMEENGHQKLVFCII